MRHRDEEVEKMRVLTKGRMKRTAARIPVPGTCGTVTGPAVSTILHHNYRRPAIAECNPIVRALIFPCSPACKDMSRNSFLWEEMYFSRPSLTIQKKETSRKPFNDRSFHIIYCIDIFLVHSPHSITSYSYLIWFSYIFTTRV